MSLNADAKVVGVFDGGGGGCDGIVLGPCAQCGKQVCTETPAGPQVQCEADPGNSPCFGDLTCTASGQCVAQIACAAGISRTCGDCGTEQCEIGMWSGECIADDESCQKGTNCLPDTPSTQNCLAACSTEGYRTPFNVDVDDFHDAGASLSATIPDIVDEGTYWQATDGCSSGKYRTCLCERKGGYGNPRVRCFGCVSDDH